MKFSNIPFLGGYEFSKKTMRRKLGRIRSVEENFETGDFVMPKPSWRNFTYYELVEATDNFSYDENLSKSLGYVSVDESVMFLP
ncbi:hypothetical protein LIER_40110 [Lithospermum erythrorhizon]|uniref:Uncharacterized protein n=1 Tax=Lithospermum erythrorhizon TaxID=34254 RepID=A0AAV3QSS7_LITER